MRLPCCTVCQNRYNEEERCPLLLQCGHGFCKECLSRMFSASPDNSLSCPRCRHVSTVGNSVTALKKNYAILALINDSSTANNYFSEEEDEDEEEEERKELFNSDNNNSNSNEVDDDVARRRRRGSHAAASCGGGGSGRIELGVHQGVKLLRIAEESKVKRPGGVEMWAAIVVGSSGRCRHKVLVKKVPVGEEMDLVWVQGQLEGLRRASMWCRNVCAFHGAARMEDGSLGLIMDKCNGSVQTEMQRNEGRLTLEQILRFFFIPNTFLV